MAFPTWSLYHLRHEQSDTFWIEILFHLKKIELEIIMMSTIYWAPGTELGPLYAEINQYLLKAYYVPSITLIAEDTVISKVPGVPA